MRLDDRHNVQKGRGATFNPRVRFESTDLDPFDDGWNSLAQARVDDLPPRTEVTPDASRSVIVRITSPDLAFDRSINPYRGCEHGCVYCFARPTHAWLGLSPGLDFETHLLEADGRACLRRTCRVRVSPCQASRSARTPTRTSRSRDAGDHPRGHRGSRRRRASTLRSSRNPRCGARPRPARADGARARPRAHLGDHARQRPGAPHGAARRRAAGASRRSGS